MSLKLLNGKIPVLVQKSSPFCFPWSPKLGLPKYPTYICADVYATRFYVVRFFGPLIIFTPWNYWV